MSLDKRELYSVKNYGFDFFAWSGRRRIATHKSEASSPIYGVELEVSTDHQIQEIVDANDYVWIAGKEDSSITGSKRNRIELVTLPATLKAHRKMWAEMFDKLGTKKFDTSRSTNNGMHVHISRESFGNKKHIRDFGWWFTNPACQPLIVEVSERGEKEDLNQYSRLPNFGSNSASRVSSRRDVQTFLSGLRGTINLGKSATVEVRLFKGIVSYATVMKNLEFVDSVLAFTAEGMPFSSNPYLLYMEWLNRQPKNKYQVIREFFAQIDLTAIREASECLWQVMGIAGGSRPNSRSISNPEAVVKAANVVQCSEGPFVEYWVKDLVSTYNQNTGKAIRWDPKTSKFITGANRVRPNHGILASADAKYINKRLSFKKGIRA